MAFIEFQSFGDLLAFLTACQTRREALGRSRQRGLYDRISVGEKKGAQHAVYRISFDARDWDWKQDEASCYGGSVSEGTVPAGREVSINDLLLELPLISRREVLKPPSVVLAIRAEVPEARSRLHQAWRKVPKQEDAESRFYDLVTEGAGLWHGVEIRDVASGFDAAQVRMGSEDAVVVFAPAWRESSCFLYVEWGYAYPKVRDFASLYLEPRGTGATLLLARAGATAPGLPRVNATWHSPEWIVATVEQYSLVEEYHDLEPVPAGQIAGAIGEAPGMQEILEAGPGWGVAQTVGHDHESSGPHSLPLNLEVGAARRLLGDASEIELHLARCSREMEDLTTRKARLASQKLNPVYPAYTFEQPVGRPVPEKLHRFLQRPLGELALYRYSCGTVDGAQRHLVVGEIPVSWGIAMAVPCDEVWLCDARWKDWNLPLFVRSDATLSVPVDERGMADLVRELIGNDHVLRETLATEGGVLLVEPAGSGGGMHFTPAMATLPLDQSFKFTNTADDTPILLVDEAALSLEREVTLPDVQVSHQVADLDSVLQNRAENLLAELEKAWETTRSHATNALLRLRVTEVAAEVGKEVCDEADQQWADFVNRVLEIDNRISKVKMEAVARWYEDEPTRIRKLKETEDARRNFESELAKSAEELAKAKAALEKDRQLLESSLGELEEGRRQAEELERQATASSDALKRTAAETKAVLDRVQEDDRQCEQMLRQLEQDRQTIDRKTNELSAKLLALEKAEAGLAEAKAALATGSAAQGQSLTALSAAHHAAGILIQSMQVQGKRRWWQTLLGLGKAGPTNAP